MKNDKIKKEIEKLETKNNLLVIEINTLETRNKTIEDQKRIDGNFEEITYNNNLIIELKKQ